MNCNGVCTTTFRPNQEIPMKDKRYPAVDLKSLLRNPELYAAAPEMLELLKLALDVVVDNIQDHGDGEECAMDSLADRIYAVIAKAEGKVE